MQHGEPAARHEHGLGSRGPRAVRESGVERGPGVRRLELHDERDERLQQDNRPAQSAQVSVEVTSVEYA